VIEEKFDGSPPGRPVPECNVASIALGMLACLQLYDGFFFCLGKRGPGPSQLQSGWVILLVTYISLGIGIAKGKRLGWWLALSIVTLLAVMNVQLSINIIHNRFWPPHRDSYDGPGTFVDIDRPPSYFRVGWLIVQDAFLVLVPVLLLIGGVRIWLRDRSHKRFH